jgi:uncharacterized RDD family membrane protein YckC
MENRELVYCGFGRRFVATLADISIFTALIAIVILAPEALIKFIYLKQIGYYSVYAIIAYFWLFFFSDLQSTPGMYIFKIKVVTKEKGKIGLFHALLRGFFVSIGIFTIIGVVLTALSGTDFILITPIIIMNLISLSFIGFTKEKTALHDLISRTRVVMR